jgi:hypothetical protein
MESEEEEVNENYLEIATIDVNTRKFRELQKDEIAKYVNLARGSEG